MGHIMIAVKIANSYRTPTIFAGNEWNALMHLMTPVNILNLFKEKEDECQS
jgi:hypothetical protein